MLEERERQRRLREQQEGEGEGAAAEEEAPKRRGPRPQWRGAWEAEGALALRLEESVHSPRLAGTHVTDLRRYG